jgi:hypothetical protein
MRAYGRDRGRGIAPPSAAERLKLHCVRAAKSSRCILRAMARDDWRLRIDLGADGAGGLLGRLGLSDAHELAKDLEKHRIEASDDEGTVFVYADSSLALERARAVIEREIAELELAPLEIVSGHWLHDEERWEE